MKVSNPIPVSLPAHGVLFAESVHAEDFRMAERTDPYHKLIYVLRGQVAYRVTAHAITAEADAGTMVMVPRGTRHQVIDRVPSVLLLLCVTDTFVKADPDLARLWVELLQQPRRTIALSGSMRQRLEEAWRRGMAERLHARASSHVMIKALAAQILAQLSRLEPHGGTEDATARISAVVGEIEDTFYDTWSIDTAAARAGMSRRRFTELFAAATGQTFWDFLTERRLAHAAQLLRRGEHSVTGVMFSCGFNDTSHFYRLFRRRFGKPPAEWAQS